ncbi:MAG: ATP phosphoribosyltransferase regulatory subunit [Eubacteriales bacterium]|nr:ATP phosphoribosyltransferase regulatory subunit [Eubacteriales bacterium]
MNLKKNQLPAGMQDTLFGEQRALRGIVQEGLTTFAAWGYDEVGTPNLEYMDVFTGDAGNYEQEQMFKLTDATGSMLVLRPDLTLPMARIAASKCRERDTLRLCYAGSAFRFDGWEPAGGLRECTQLGVEWMGQTDPQVDAELVALAVTTLQNIGLTDFQMEIGQVEFFKGLMEEAGFSPRQAEQVRLQVESKNALAIELLMQSAKAEAGLMNTIRELPALYGGVEVLDKAWEMSRNPRCRAALNNIRSIWEILDDFGLGGYVSVDLGMVNSLNYYTGMIMRGISRHVGYPILTGGRYDTLSGEFGKPMPATGFAFAAETMLRILRNQGTLPAPARKRMLLYVLPGCRKEAFAALHSLRDEGIQVEQYYGDVAQLAACAAQTGARAAVFGGQGLTVLEEGE